ncbi:hypothetical protein BX616_007867 [Lobosporangium transversale]|nr:hypothetical protein BX616_007867 [Lobosporangium transversale]
MSRSELGGIIKQTFSAALTKISPLYANAQLPVTKSSRIPFRPQLTKQIATEKVPVPSISGLQFCLHMMVFATPGIIFAKKLCDGEQIEDMITNTQDNVSKLINSLS